MNEQTYLLFFDGVSPAEANRYAEELREALLDATTEIDVQRQRENPLTQDLGASLALIMGVPALVAAVNAIGNWLQKRRSASLTIMRRNSCLIICQVVVAHLFWRSSQRMQRPHLSIKWRVSIGSHSWSSIIFCHHKMARDRERDEIKGPSSRNRLCADVAPSYGAGTIH